MTFTLDIYLYFLEREFELIRPTNMDGAVNIKRVCPWQPGSSSSDELFILPGRIPECTAPLAMHVAARDLPPQTPGKDELWLLAPESSYESVLYRAIEIFFDFIRFTGEVTVLTLAKRDLRGALAMMRDALGIELFIIDKDYLVLESLPHENNAPLYEAGGMYLNSGMRMDASQVENLYLTDPRFDETFTLHGLRMFCRYDYPDYKGLCLYYNFFLRGRYAGRLIYVMRADIYSDKLLPFLEEYSALIYECFRNRDEHNLTRSASAVHRYLLDLVKKDEENAALALAAFQRIGWEAEDSFRAICLTGKGYAQSEMTMSYLCTMLEDTFPACVAASRGQTIYCLHDRTREDRTDFSGDLAIFLRDNLLQAGLSCVFTGLENSGSYFQEAEAALFFGEQADDSFWLHYFHDHTLSYILAKAEENVPSEDLYSPVLKTLLAHDSEHPELSLTETLYAYLCCHFNASRAAETLFIHRTTFLYRMNKLRSLVKLDLEDFDTLTGLMLSFAIWRRHRA